jgi:transcriptional regulator with XRE-family HTH domain
MTFHEWLREKLISRNYTQDEFGKAVGVTGQAVNHWVNGNKLPSIKNMRKIANVLNIAEQEVLEAAGLLKKTEKGEESTYNIQSRNGYQNIDEKLKNLAKHFPQVFLDKFGELSENEKLDIIDVMELLIDQKRKREEQK